MAAVSSRPAHHGESEDALGPVVQNLGSSLRTSAGRMRMIVVAILCALALIVFGMGCVVFVGGLLSGAYSLGEQAAALAAYGGLGLLFLGFAVVLVILLSRTTAMIHTHGLLLTQTFFRTDRIFWHDVSHIEVPRALGRWVSCHIVLRSGRRDPRGPSEPPVEGGTERDACSAPGRADRAVALRRLATAGTRRHRATPDQRAVLTQTERPTGLRNSTLLATNKGPAPPALVRS